MKIGILTLYYGDKFKEDTKYGRISLMNYCQKYGYDFIEDDTLVKAHEREIQWTKVLLIQKYLQYKNESNNSYYNYLIWIDADIFIMNPEKTIEGFIDRLMNGKDLMYSKDFGGWVNNGVMFIKNTERILRFFIETWKHTNEICREQGAQDMLWRHNWDNCQTYITITENQREYNPVWHEYEYGQFIMHFPGAGEPQRKPNSLRDMMRMFCPIKMDDDTDETYFERIRWLKEDATRVLKEKRQLCINRGIWKYYFPTELD